MNFATITQAVRRWQERNRARHELQRLTDRDLADIGLNRCGIDAAVRGDPTSIRASRHYYGR